MPYVASPAEVIVDVPFQKNGSASGSPTECRVTRRLLRVSVWLSALLAGVLALPPAHAQMFSYGADRAGAVQSLAFAYKMVGFEHDGASAPQPSFEYSGPAYGAEYTRPNLTASVLYGRESDPSERDLRILDASIMTWGRLRLGGSGPTGLFAPIAIHTNYRRVAPRGSENSIVDAFNVTVIGLGTGIGFEAPLSRTVRFETRAMGVLGLAMRAFGDSAGSSHLFDGDAHIHIAELVGRFGLTAGYGFRAQRWNLSASEFLQEQASDLLDYLGSSHVFSLGVNW